MTTQPEALRWVHLLEYEAASHGATDYKHKAAAELRRLHEVNQELLEALKDCLPYVQEQRGDMKTYITELAADKAIAKATGEQA